MADGGCDAGNVAGSCRRVLFAAAACYGVGYGVGLGVGPGQGIEGEMIDGSDADVYQRGTVQPGGWGAG